MKKKIIILLILIIAIFAFVKYFKYKKSLVYTVVHIDAEDYFLLMENDRYGVINKNGDVVIDPVYDVVEIPNPTKPLFICKNNYNQESNEYNVQVFDESKNQLLYQYYIVEGIRLNNVEDNGFYEKTVLRYKSNDKYGLIDFDGKKITEAVYDSIEGFEYKEGLLLVNKSGKYGIININGATVLKENYDEIISDAYYTEQDKYQKSGYFVGNKTNDGMRYGYINCDGKQILKNNYNELYRIVDKKDDDNVYIIAFENGRAGLYKNNKKIVNNEYEDILYSRSGDLLILQKNSKQGVAKIDGTQIIPIEYDNIYVEDGYINTQKGDKSEKFSLSGEKIEDNTYSNQQTVADGKYKIVYTPDEGYKIISEIGTVPGEYEYIQYLFEDYFYVSKKTKKGIINSKGEILLALRYNVIQKINDFNIIQVIDSEGTTTLLDKELNEIAKGTRANIYRYNEYIRFRAGNDSKYFDKDGNEIKNTEIYKDNNLIAYKDNAKWGFKNKEGKIIVEATYDYVTELNRYGYAGIKLNDKWGVIKEDGTILKSPTYTINSLNEPYFIGEYYKVDLGYGIPYYTN